MTTEKKRGRPKKLELVTLDEAIKIISDHWHGKFTPSKGTIYNKISKKLLTNHGAAIHKVLLDKDEVIEKLCS